MDSDVLLLSYLDKIRLTLTGEAGQALAYLYSEAMLYKGAGTASLSQSTTPCSTGNISVSEEESRPLQHLLVLTCTCWLTPRGSAGASQGVSVIVWPRHPRRQVPSPSLAS